MNPRKSIKYIEKESFKKSKIYYQKTEQKPKDSAPIALNLEEYEALRLYHYKHLSQGLCAKNLNISQPTFSRILRSAIDKLVKALVEESDFEILGGNVVYKEWIGWGCFTCDHEWNTSQDLKKCPKCDSDIIYKLKKLASYFSEQ